MISVGNLTVGGTGKTPFVEMLARRIARKNRRVAILARGYGRHDRGDDEDMLADAQIENVVRLAGSDRVENARRAIEEFRADAILLDDGFQHFRIRRHLDIVLIDATNPFAGERLIPRGLLRERPSCAARADLIVLTRTDQVGATELSALRDRLSRLATDRPVIEAAHRPVSVRVLPSRKRQAPEWLRGRRCYAFCGIGNPEAFRKTLESVGAEVVKFRTYADHYLYDLRDLRQLNAEAQEFMADVVVTTEKDATKLNPEAFELPLAALRVEVEITRGEEELEACLKLLLPEGTPVGAL